jgi:hypothetical protein
MGFAQWLRLADTLSGLVQVSARTWGGRDQEPGLPAGRQLGALETRLAGVLVGALKEAFDRDSARTDLEREHLESERRRAEAALRAELRRQAAERALGQLRLMAVMAFVVCMIAVAVGVWLPGMREALPRTMMGIGLALAIGALGCTFAAWQYVSAWSADMLSAESSGVPRHTAGSAAPWLLLSSLALVIASLLSAL